MRLIFFRSGDLKLRTMIKVAPAQQEVITKKGYIPVTETVIVAEAAVTKDVTLVAQE